MTLSAEMNVRLDSTGAMASLTGELSGSIGDLQTVELGLTVETADGAGSAAAQIDLGPLNDTVAGVLADLAGVVDGLPVAGDLIGPIEAGIATLDRVFSGHFEEDVTAAVARVGAEFDALDSGDTLSALRRLAEGLTGASELGAVQSALSELMQLAGGEGGDAAGLADIVQAVLSMLDAIGQMMTLETMLAEGQRLGLLVEAQLPDGTTQDLTANWAAMIAGIEAQLNVIDTASDTGVDAAVEAMITARATARQMIETLNHGMAFGEATLTYADPDALVARSEAVLQALRGVAMDQIEAAVARVAALIAPVFQIDMSGVPQFSLDGLITDIETRAAEFATEIADVDLSGLTAPLTDGLGTIAGMVDDVRTTLDQAQAKVQAGLGDVRDAVAALPIDQVVDALRDVTDVIAGVLETLADLLGGAEAAIGDAAGAAQAALARAETAVTDFRSTLNLLFGEARDFVDGLGLDQAVGTVAAEIQRVADVIGQADMTPYFGTAQDAIDTTAGVIDAVPFALLPDEMEQEVVDLVRPIKTADADAFRTDIREVLQIDEDGSFALRDDLEAAVGEVQTQFDALVAEMAALDPQLLADEINSALDDVRAEIETVVPAVELAPLTEALDAAKALVAGLDLSELLDPLSDGFDTVLEQVDDFAPSVLLAPLDAQVDALRQKVLDVTHLEDWQAKLDETRAAALDLITVVDPDQVQAPLEAAFAEAQRLLSEGNLPDPLKPFGAVISGLLSGSGEVVMPEAMTQVAGWLRGQAVGADRLQAMTLRMRDGIASARAEVVAADPNDLALMISADSARLQTLIAALAAGPARDRLLAAAEGLDLSADLRLMAPHHTRFVDVLTRAEAQADALAVKGFGEVDSVGGVIRLSLAPIAPLLDTPKAALERMGFSRFGDGLGGLLSEIFEDASPARLAGILVPVYQALHGRVEALLDAIIQPLRDMIDDLLGIVNLFDLSALSTALDDIHAEIRADIAAFHPTALLGDVISGFEAAQTAVDDFDPLGPVIDTLDTLKTTVARVLDLLDGEALLAVPIEVFDQIMDLLGALNLNALLGPLYDRLDAIAAQVSGGLDGTVTSFKGLQDALPGQVGSTTISGSVTVTVGGG